MITREQIIRIMPGAAAHVDPYIDPLNKTMQQLGITTPQRQAAFLAQILHESAGFSRTRENLNYTPEALLATFNTPRVTRFTKVDAYRYGRTTEHPASQEMIANIAYAGRFGNGLMESGDGWRYRGGGPGQLTFKDNYARCGTTIGVDLVHRPELIETPAIGVLAFGWFWVQGNASCKDLSLLADAGDINSISRVVNGGDNGIEQRAALFEQLKEVA